MGDGVREVVTAERLLVFVQTHPDCTPRQVAEHFYGYRSAALSVGSRLASLARAGFLQARFHDGWHYRPREEG